MKLRLLSCVIVALAFGASAIADDLLGGGKGNGGGGHFSLKIASSQFCGKSQIMRHRLIYQVLADLIPLKIHALSIDAQAS